MANSVSVNTTNKDLWAGGAEPYKASYGKLMMWFFLISDAFTFSAFLIAYGVIRFRHPGYEGTLSDFSFLKIIGRFLKRFSKLFHSSMV